MTVQRRHVLQAGVLGLAATLPGSPASGAAGTRAEPPSFSCAPPSSARRLLSDVSVQLGSVWRPLPTGAWAHLVGRGVVGVEVPDVSLLAHADTLERLEMSGLTPKTVVFSGWTTVEPSRWRELCGSLARRGVGRVVAPTTGHSPFGFERSEAFWRDRSSDLNRLGEIASAAGVSLLYRHGQHEFLRSSTGSRVLDLLASRVEPGVVRLSIDARQSARAGVDPLSLLDRYPVDQLLLGNYEPDGEGTATTLTDGLLDIGQLAGSCPPSTDLVVDLGLPVDAGPSSSDRLKTEIDRSLSQLQELLQLQAGVRDV